MYVDIVIHANKNEKVSCCKHVGFTFWWFGPQSMQKLFCLTEFYLTIKTVLSDCILLDN